jgi:hypothetical protein
VSSLQPDWVPMKARTTPTQPRSSEGDQAVHAADFIDSIDPQRTFSAVPLSKQCLAVSSRGASLSQSKVAPDCGGLVVTA